MTTRPCYAGAPSILCHVLYRPLGCERGNLCIIYAMTFLRCRAMRFVCIFIILGWYGMGGRGGQWHSLHRVTTAIKKKHILSKCLSIFIPLPPQSQKEGFYWDEVSSSLEVILRSRACLLMDCSIASVCFLKFDCDFKDFPFSLPLKPGGIIQPFTKEEVLAQRNRAGEGWEDINFGLLLNNYSVAWMHRLESFDNKPHQSALAHYCNPFKCTQ